MWALRGILGMVDYILQGSQKLFETEGFFKRHTRQTICLNSSPKIQNNKHIESEFNPIYIGTL